jgi:hypothetical protein
MRTQRGTLILAMTALAAVTFAAPASATTHYGGVTLQPPVEEPRIGPQAPTCNPQTSLPSEAAPEVAAGCQAPPTGGDHIQTVTAAYNDLSGSLTIKVTIFDPELWGAVLPAEGFTVGPVCHSEELEGNFQGETSIYNPRITQLNQETDAVELHGYKGSVEASSAIWNGNADVFVWQESSFARRDWRCISLSDGVSFKLNGWPTPKRRHHR